MKCKQNIVTTVLVIFALVGFGESYSKFTTYVSERNVEMKQLSEFEVLKKQVCMTAAAKDDISCKTP